MTKSVVDQFEMIDIDNQRGHRPVFGLRNLAQMLNVGHRVTTIEQARQCVGHRGI